MADTQLPSIETDPNALASIKPIAPLAPAYDPQKAFNALDEVVGARKAATQAEIEAATANNAVATQLSATQDQIDEHTLKTLGNITRIERLGPVAGVLSLFDSDFNARSQQTELQIDSVKSNQATRRAQAQISINSNKPAILSKQAELATQNFQLFKDTFDVALKSRELDQKDIQILTERARLNIDMNEETRKQLKFKIDSMGDNEIASALKDARAGKGDWVPFKGFLENELDTSEKVKSDLKLAQIAVSNGDIDLADKYRKHALALVPIDHLRDAVAKAVNNSEGDITWGGVKIPLDQAMVAVEDNQKRLDGFNTSILAESSAELNEKLTRVSTAAAALSKQDPRVARDHALLARARANTNDNNYPQVKQLNSLVDTISKRIDGYAAENAKAYKSATAQAGAKQFFDTGKFTPEGAEAVANESINNPAASRTAFYSNAYQVYSKRVAAILSRQRITGLPNFDGSAASGVDIMAFALRQAPEKLNEITDQVLADTTAHAEAHAAIVDQLSESALDDALSSLSSDKDANPIWGELRNYSSVYSDPVSGNKSPEKLLEYLFQRTVATGGKVDFPGLLISQIRKQQADANTSDGLGDPRFSTADYALETKHFGSNPRGAILQDFLKRLMDGTREINAQMSRGVSQDLSGKTKLKAVQALGASGMDPTSPYALEQLEQTQSATGAPASVNRIRELYGK